MTGCQREVVGAAGAQRVWRGTAPVLCMHPRRPPGEPALGSRMSVPLAHAPHSSRCCTLLRRVHALRNLNAIYNACSGQASTAAHFPAWVIVK